MRFAEDTLPATCGVGVLFDFQERGSRWLGETIDEIKSDMQAGSGWYVVGFINTKTCRAAYEDLISNTKLIYQSPVRRNRNSKNDFFFCIFDLGDPNEN